MKPGDLRRWTITGGLILIVRIYGRDDGNGYCDYLENGKIYEWVPVLNIKVNSEVIDGKDEER